MARPDEPPTPSDGARTKVLDESARSLHGPAEPTMTVVDGDAPTGPVPPPRVDAALDPVASGWPDLLWQRYTFVRLLGTGGMGRVFEAVDTSLSRRVALKVLLGDSLERLQRFLREAQAQARIEHPNVCKVYEVGEVAGRPYIAMQLIPGHSLHAAAAKMSLEQKVLVLRQVAEAVHAAHRAGLIHRDLKPANVMIESNEDGTLLPYVVDFGLARVAEGEALTADNATLGTPAYMAPEQAMGGSAQVDRRADVYSLGATLYACLAGRPPFEGSSAMEVLLKVVGADPAPLRLTVPSVPVDLETVVTKCLEKDPGRRYSSARALADDLGRFLDGEPVMARPVGALGRVARKARKHRLLVAAGGLALLTCLTLGWMWWQTRQAAVRQAELAQRFGQHVEQLESTLWRAQSLPPHDVRPDRARLREGLNALEGEMAHLGRLAAGPGHTALGRGYLALHEDQKAREHLEKAWSGGFRSAQTAYALGLALGRLYDAGLAEARRVSDSEVRSRRLRELETTLRDPALAYLRSGASTVSLTPEYVAGLIALYEGRWAEAIEKARAAFARVPWLYEAKALEAQAHLLDGDSLTARGSYPQAEAAFAVADRAVVEAALIARSDPDVLLQRCVLAGRVIYLKTWYLANAADADFEGAIAACRATLVADPDNAAAMMQLAVASSSWAEARHARGESPEAQIDASIAAAQNALRVRPGWANAHEEIAMALWERGKYFLDRGGPAGDTLREAAASARRAIAAAPDRAEGKSTLGIVLMDLAVHEMTRKTDPTAILEEAVEVLKQAAEQRPKSSSHAVNLGIAHALLVDWRASVRSPDTVVTAQRAMAVLERARELNPNLFYTHRTMGQVATSLSSYVLATGGDPRPHLAAAEVSLARAVALNPGDRSTHLWLAEARMVAAECASRRGESTTDALGGADKALRRAGEIDPASTEVRDVRARFVQLRRRLGTT